MSSSVDDWERDISELAASFPFVHTVQTLDKNPEALKMRLFLGGNLFVQIYVNLVTGTRNFVLVLGGHRLYGRDCEEGRNWHRHPYGDPTTHDFELEGTRPVTVLEFLQEVQEIVDREGLV
jgi:hypothetical protein